MLRMEPLVESGDFTPTLANRHRMRVARLDSSKTFRKQLASLKSIAKHENQTMFLAASKTLQEMPLHPEGAPHIGIGAFGL